MLERLPAWLKNKWVLYGLSAGATLVLGMLIFLIFLRGAFAGLLANQGQKALDAHDYNKAANKYATALTLKKNREEIYLGYAKALIGLEDHQTAGEILDRGIKKIGGAEELYLCKVQALVTAGKIGTAVDFLDSIQDSYINKKIQAARPADLSYSPAQGKYGKTQKFTLDLREGETVYYTLNGEDPTMASAVYKEPVTISTTATLTAISVSSNGLVSPRLRISYEIDNANEAFTFIDAKIERMVRAVLDRPNGNLYAAQLASITELANDGIDGSIRSLKDLEYLPALQHLRINDELLIDDYAPLAGLPELTTLSMTGCALSDSDLAHIAGLTQLTDLEINNNQITSLKNLAGLQNLTYLHASNNDLSSSSELQAFANMNTLYLSGNRLLELDGIASLTKLITLDVSKNYISDLSPLTGLSVLAELHLNGNTPNNLKKLSVLPSLAYLDISNCGLASLSVVNNYPALQVLIANDNQIASLSTFTKQVIELCINRNPLADISDLKSQTILANLEAAGTQISDISFLAGSTSLVALDIAGTQVTDATGLKNCPQLTCLVCSEKCSTAGLPETVDVIIN